MRRYLIAVFCAVWATACAAQDKSSVVVELFTSQGCSSCPPADEILAKLSEYDHVIPLAFHVDYWDYIGWKDVFARPEFTQRQKRYAVAQDRASIFTPQAIVQGRHSLVGSDAVGLMNTIDQVKSRVNTLGIDVTSQGNTGQIVLTQTSGGPFDVTVLSVQPKSEQDITQGENAGSRLVYTNIVRGLNYLGEWSGQAEWSASFEKQNGMRHVLLLQSTQQGAIYWAGRLD